MSKPHIDVDSFWLPHASSTIAHEIDWALGLVSWISAIVFVGIVAASLYFVIRFRRRSENDKLRGIDHAGKLELFWTIVPACIFIGFFAVGFRGYVKSSVAPAESLEIQVTAQMYSWTFTYPDGTVMMNELGIPKDRPVKLIMSSTDTLHSFYVPEFRLKQDVVPGQYTTLWFEANDVRDTAIECAEYCGVGHSNMFGTVKVMEQAKFDQWLENGGAGDTKLPPAERGKQIFETKSCAGCHSTDGSKLVGPSFKGVWGRTETMSDGKQVEVDENYVRESLMHPQAKIVQGYPGSMPSFEGALKDKDVDAIIAFLKTVK
jgi:cytochrome c oxidase subunit 2